jgi:hypothetical protein
MAAKGPVSRVVPCLLLTGTTLVSAGPLAAAALCVNPGGTGGCFSTLGAAVAAADATAETDTIDVAAGTYPEVVVIPSTEPGLTIRGANFGVDPCTAARAAESIVGTAGGALQVLADGVTIGGFTIEGVTGGLAAGLNALGNADTHVLDNVIQNNVIGVAIGGSGALIEHNDIRNNNNAGSAAGTGIYSDTGLINSTINANCFTGHQNQATNLIGSPVVAGAVSGLTFTDNVATNDSGYAFFGGSNLTVTGNQNIDNAVGSSYFFDAVSGAVVNGNLALDGSFSGIRLNSPAAVGPSSNVTASCNRLVGHGVAAINVEAGSHVGTLSAENNWFGCNAGPGSAGCDAVLGDVDFDPWLVLTLTASPSTVPSGSSSLLTASLGTNSDGGVAPCSVPDGTEVSFSSACGTVDPTLTTTTAGEATSMLTGGPPGPCQAAATVDNETVTEDLAVDPIPIVSIPTLSAVGLALLVLMTAGLALWRLRAL